MSNAQLIGFRDHCRAMAERKNGDDSERVLWRQLADEITAYLAGELEETTTGEQLTLGGET